MTNTCSRRSVIHRHILGSFTTHSRLFSNAHRVCTFRILTHVRLNLPHLPCQRTSQTRRGQVQTNSTLVRFNRHVDKLRQTLQITHTINSRHIGLFNTRHRHPTTFVACSRRRTSIRVVRNVFRQYRCHIISSLPNHTSHRRIPRPHIRSSFQQGTQVKT